MTVMHASRFRAAVEGARSAQKLLAEEGLSEFVKKFVANGIFTFDQILEVKKC
jgi:hypothetical protein